MCAVVSNIFPHKRRIWTSFRTRLASVPSPSTGAHSSRRDGKRVLVLLQRRSFSEDSTLAWARAHAELAQRCLLPPLWDIKACDEVYQSQFSHSLKKYLCWRRWPYVVPTSADIPIDQNHPSDELKEKTLRLSSHVLSAPLTLASFAIQDDEMLPLNTRVACIGARAEATIPSDLWKEFLLFTSTSSSSTTSHVTMKPTYTIDFIGPDVIMTSSRKIRETKVELEDTSSLLLRWLYRGYLHDLLSKDPNQASKWDALVFYNPGFGHPHLKEGWKPTLDLVLPLPYPMLFTAHSEIDAQRDMEFLRDSFGLQVDYRENPFASQISYQDPFDMNHHVRPNHYVARLDRRHQG